MPTPERFAIESLFHVVDKHQNAVPFKLNSAQATIDDNYNRRMILPKARQEGVSTYFLARSTIRCLGVKNTRAVVISHDSESTERMFAKVKYFLETMNGPKAVIKTNTKNELAFPKTNSVFYIGTAGSRAFGRGDTITDLHCSEVAYWPDPKKTMTGLLQAVPKATGCVSIESTGNGAGNWYHSQCMRAAKGQSSYKLMFLPWHDFAEYTLLPHEAPAELELREDIHEPELKEAYGLTNAQILWRRQVLEDELDGDLFAWNKEYPSCLDDCFQTAGAGIFRSVNYIESPEWKQVNDRQLELNGLWKLDSHPKPGLHYIVGADVAAGVGKDSSVAEIFCLETDEQVGEYINNMIEPDVFAIKLAHIGRLFNEAFIGCESNNHGILTLKELGTWCYETSSVMYPLNKIYRTPIPVSHSAKDQVRRIADLGVRTTSKNKPYIIGMLRADVAMSGTVVIHSPILRNELSTFVEHEDGTMGAADGCHDDCVMASAMARFVKSRGAMSLLDNPITAYELKPKDNPFMLDGIIKEMTSNRDEVAPMFPIHITDF